MKHEGHQVTQRLTKNLFIQFFVNLCDDFVSFVLRRSTRVYLYQP